MYLRTYMCTYAEWPDGYKSGNSIDSVGCICVHNSVHVALKCCTNYSFLHLYNCGILQEPKLLLTNYFNQLAETIRLSCSSSDTGDTIHTHHSHTHTPTPTHTQPGPCAANAIPGACCATETCTGFPTVHWPHHTHTTSDEMDDAGSCVPIYPHTPTLQHPHTDTHPRLNSIAYVSSKLLVDYTGFEPVRMLAAPHTTASGIIINQSITYSRCHVTLDVECGSSPNPPNSAM